jgi:hypothetical protein
MFERVNNVFEQMSNMFERINNVSEEILNMFEKPWERFAAFANGTETFNSALLSNITVAD